ncbi:hypothetical protein ACG2F4_09790 [Halalkalibaculum sp. DA3122]|uniref:hypothetical protein n=1 Tax=unclassified Halalkalibaculum TaxID=2964617 RepID=UPI0037542EBC
MNSIKKILVLAIALPVVLVPAAASGQVDLNQLEPEEYFDFWVGTWDLTWEAPNGVIETGTSTVEKILDGNVLLENFEAKSGRFAGYEGKSFSVYQKTTGKWRQTWVDDSSEYIDFEGVFEGNKRIFTTEGPGTDGNRLLKRMVFYNITDSSFTWDWKTSPDSGQTWNLAWRIHYERKL